MEFKKGDVCSIEVVVAEVWSNKVRVDHGYCTLEAQASDLTLLRRAPVDLAMCELPVDVVWVKYSGETIKCRLHHRGKERGFVVLDDGDEVAPFLSALRHADAPAPAADAGEVERLRAKCDMLSAYVRSLEALLAQDAPTCPPGHITIGDRAVPEPMREAPEDGAEYWLADLTRPGGVTMQMRWVQASTEKQWLARGLIHSTEAAARAHAEALIAPTKREASHD